MRISITFIALLLSFLAPALSLTSDGVVLLSFKYAVLADPLGVLDSWNYDDASPCLWTGVSCKSGRVTSLVLPNSQLSGPVSPHLSLIQTLQEIDLSGNSFKGPLPLSILNASNLQKLSLAGNSVSGEVPALIGMLPSLKLLNLSRNSLTGKLPGGFKYVEVLDISSNSLTGSVPVNFGGEELQLLDLSKNKLSGSIPPQFAASIPGNATINLAFNTLTGEIPQTLSFLNQKSEAFAGNAGLCGKPLTVLCSIPSTLSIPPELNSSSPAIAAIPRIISSDPAESGDDDGRSRRLQPMAIAGIVVGDVAGLGLLAIVILFVHQMKNKKENKSAKPTSDPPPAAAKKAPETHQITIVDNLSPSPDHRHRHSAFSLFPCLPLRPEPDTSDCTSSDADLHHPPPSPIARTGVLVTLSDDAVIEMETLLKASAYVLGASGSSIVYKAVTQGGAAFAVRRIGDGCVKKMKEFEAQVRGVAKLRHPNLVRTLGFYWGQDEKLVIYELAANGSLASALTRKQGASTVHLNLEARLRVARGLARGLAFIHEKKQAHGNIKPSNILLDAKLEPLISDLGLDRLIASPRPDFGSMRSTASREGLLESSASCSGGSPYAAASTSSSAAVSAFISASPYHAPEALRSLKVSAKWDVYSFGVVLLELLTGKALHGFELAPWAAACFTAEEEERVLRMTDVSIRCDVALREDATLACFKLGFGCANLAPGKRPTMKEAVQALEKIVG